MASSPVNGKQISVQGLVMGLIVSGLVIALFAGQLLPLTVQQVPPDLSNAIKAFKTNDETSARKYLDAFVGHNSRQDITYVEVMQVCNEVKRYDVSREYGLRGLDILKYQSNSARAILYSAMATTYVEEREPRPQVQATRYARRAFEMDSHNPEVLNLIGYILVDNATTLVEIEEGLNYINRAIADLQSRVESRSPFGLFGSSAVGNPYLLTVARDSYGWALYKRGKYHPQDFQTAADVLTDVVQELPDALSGDVHKEVYYHLGVANRAAGRLTAARNALEVALHFDPNFEVARQELAGVNGSLSVPDSRTSGNTSPQRPAPLPATVQAPGTMKSSGSQKAFSPIDSKTR